MKSFAYETNRMHRRTVLAALSLLAGCSLPTSEETPTVDERSTASPSPTSDPTTEKSPTQTPSASESQTATQTEDGSVPTYGFSTNRANGNRYVEGQANLEERQLFEVSFPAPPVWISGATDGEQTIWAMVLEDGSVRGVRMTDTPEKISLGVDSARGPPLLALGEKSHIVVPDSLAPHTAPVPAPGGISWVRGDGKLETSGGVVDVNALPDAMPVAANERVFVLAGPTEEYDHGALGDSVEATEVAVVDPLEGTVVRRLSPPAGVIEGRSPIVAKLGGDPAVIVTTSDAQDGARIVALGVDGSWQAVGPPIGAGKTWRHQIAVAPFGSGDEANVAAIKTPHASGVAEFYRRNGDQLEIVASQDGGYTSHERGSRNLGGGLAIRLVKRDQTALIVPNDSRQELVALGEKYGTIQQATTIPLNGRLTSNIAAVGGVDLSLAVGTDSGLRIWKKKKQ